MVDQYVCTGAPLPRTQTQSVLLANTDVCVCVGEWSRDAFECWYLYFTCMHLRWTRAYGERIGLFATRLHWESFWVEYKYRCSSCQRCQSSPNSEAVFLPTWRRWVRANCWQLCLVVQATDCQSMLDFQQALEFPSLLYPRIVRIPRPSPHCASPFFIPIPALCIPPVKDPTTHCAFPYIPHPTLWRLLMPPFLSPSPHCAITLIPLSLWPLPLSRIVHTPFPDLSPAWCELPRMARHVIPSLFGLVPVCIRNDPAHASRHCDLNFWFWHYTKLCFGLLLKITFWLLPFYSELLPLRR